VHHRTRPPAAALLALGTAAAVALTGCSAGPATDPTAAAKPAGHHVVIPGADTPSQPPASPSASPSPTSAGNTGEHAVLVANGALSSSLFGLVTASNKAKVDNSLRDQRKAMAAALSAARTALSAERTAAYGGVRSCARVDGNLTAVRSAAGRVSGLRAQLLARTAKVRGDLGRMSAARAQVAKRLAAMESAVKAAHATPTPVIAQVKAALAQETRDQAAILASIRSVEQKATSTVATANGVRTNAESIAVKAC
jgi:hypothetical protein